MKCYCEKQDGDDELKTLTRLYERYCQFSNYPSVKDEVKKAICSIATETEEKKNIIQKAEEAKWSRESIEQIIEIANDSVLRCTPDNNIKENADSLLIEAFSRAGIEFDRVKNKTDVLLEKRESILQSIQRRIDEIIDSYSDYTITDESRSIDRIIREAFDLKKKYKWLTEEYNEEELKRQSEDLLKEYGKCRLFDKRKREIEEERKRINDLIQDSNAWLKRLKIEMPMHFKYIENHFCIEELERIEQVETNLLDKAGIKKNANDSFEFENFKTGFENKEEWNQRNKIISNTNEWITIGRNSKGVLFLSKYPQVKHYEFSEKRGAVWSEGNIREMLNTVFIKCFDDKHAKLICTETRFKTAANEEEKITSADNIFLLSNEDVYNHLPLPEERIMFDKDSNRALPWLLSSYLTIDEEGNIDKSNKTQSSDYVNIRPAFWINLEAIH